MTHKVFKFLTRAAVVAAISLSFVLLPKGFTQTTRGTVTGTITDPSGAVIANAKVTLLAPDTNVAITVETNHSGVYRFDAVLVGNYKVTAETKGFVQASTDAVVTVGAVISRSITLHPGDSTTIEVSDSIEQLESGDATRRGVISTSSLASLPISGQNSLNLMLLLPGVAASKTGSNADGGIGAINGARPRSNNFLLDGINNNDISVMGPQFSTTNNDALQEVSIQTSNFSAEFGRAGGAVVSQVTKSGSNQLHGTAAWVYKSDNFDASTQTQRNTWRNAGGASASDNILIPKYVDNTPAFTFGGPVVIPHFYDGHSKTFFFGAGQWDHYSSGGTQSSFTVPTTNGYSVLSALTSSCPNVASYLNALGSVRGAVGTGTNSIPIDVQSNLASTTCTGTARSGQVVEVGSYVRTVPELSKDNNHLLRIDHVASEKQNLTFRWLWDSNSDNVGGTIGVNSQFDVPFKSRYMSGSFIDNYAVSSTIFNEFRFGYSRNNYGWLIGNGIASTLPAISVSGISSLALSSNYPQGRISNTWQYNDSVTWLKGRHAFKGGIEILRQYAVQVAPMNTRGSYTYASSTLSGTIITYPVSALTNFIDNYGGAGGAVSIVYGSPRYHPNLLTLSGFVQDNFKVNSELMLTFGLRYENFGQPANIFKYPTYNNGGLDSYLDTTRAARDNNNFGPSVGFAYSPKNRNLVIRGGYSISYDSGFNNLLSNMAAGTPNALSNQAIVSTTTTTTPRGYVGLSSASLAAVALNPYVGYASQFKKDMANPFYYHYSLGVQQALPGGTILDLSYVGSSGHQLYFSNNVNPLLPNATYTGNLTQVTASYGTQYKRLNSSRGSITARESGMTSNYNSLQLTVSHNPFTTPAGKLYFTGSYTWSKNVDNLSDVFATYSSGAYGSKSITQYGPAKNFDHGPSDLDRRHNGSVALQLDLRGVHQPLLNRFVGGWTLTPVVQAYSGAPYTIFNGTDRDLDGASTNDRPNVGNPNAPINTRAVITSTSNCSTGYYDPNKRTSSSIPISSACVSPSAAHWVQAPTYDPINAAMEHRNAVTAGRYINLNLNVLKTFALYGMSNFELRGEFFNLPNIQNFDGGTAASSVSSTSNTFQNFTLVSGGARSFRVGGKFIF